MVTTRQFIIMKHLVYLVLVCIALLISSCNPQATKQEFDQPSESKYYGASNHVEAITIDSCEYLIPNNGGIVHKENCKNLIHNK